MDVKNNPTGQFGQLQEIIDFAIEREQEAIDFYSDVASRMKTRSLADELRKIAAMEVQHKDRLQRIDLVATAADRARKVADLKIADYLVAPLPSPAMTWQEILNVAMHRELASMRLYTDLARMAGDGGSRRLFEKLAAEEATHKLFFERSWDDEVLIEN